MDWTTIVFAFLAMFGTGLNWWHNKKQLEKIPIYFNDKKLNLDITRKDISRYFNDKKLNLDITRKDISRQELQGILGILRKDMKEHYHIEYLSTLQYLDAIYNVQRCRSDKLTIFITAEELKQFRETIYE
jgi:hypothetical protein